MGTPEAESSTYPVSIARSLLLEALETIPAVNSDETQKHLCDLATSVALDASRASSREGLLAQAHALRLVAGAIVGDPPVTVSRAAAIHAAVQVCDSDDALARVPALLAAP